MYSIVLMMALSGGAESTDFGKKCHGASGCTAPVAASCKSSCKAARTPLIQKKDKCHGAAPACSGAKVGLFHKAKASHGCAGSAPVCSGAVMVPATPAKDMPKETIPTPPAKTTMVPTPATNVATLSADAPLSVATASVFEVRTVTAPTRVMGRLFSR